MAAGAAIRLTQDERRELEQLAHGASSVVARRARILLLAADGMRASAIASSLHTSRTTVGHWRQRFAAERLAGITRVGPGRGRKPRIAREELRARIAAVRQRPPRSGTTWTGEALARELGVSPATVSRALRGTATVATSGRFDALVRLGRTALLEHRWNDAYELFVAADRARQLSPGDLEELAVACTWSGHPQERITALQRLHAMRMQDGDRRGAARAAVELARRCWDMGATSIAAGWLARAERHLARDDMCAEMAMVCNRRAYVRLRTGDAPSALRAAQQAEQIAATCGAHELQLIALHLQGQSRVATGDLEAGFRLVDEVCSAAIGGELGPDATGLVYCWTIAVCRDVADHQRCVQLTTAASAWCEEHSIAGYPGICRIHRAEILRSNGELAAAEQDAAAAAAELTRYNLRQAGIALNEVGLIRLRRGRLDGADEAFAQAVELGADVEPGRSLLLVAKGRHGAALHSVTRALERAAGNPALRARLLPSHVDIAIANGLTPLAQRSADELARIAAQFAQPALRAAAAQASGAVMLACGDGRSASAALSDALDLWVHIGAPYEAARTRVLLSRSRRVEHHDDAARTELSIAARTFERIGAELDARRADAELHAASTPQAPLTPRQIEVARLVAEGLHSREIGRRLHVSARTAEYHVRQIMLKTGFTARAQIAGWYALHQS